MERSSEVDEYVAALAPEVAERMEAIRSLVGASVPDAGEKISYKMPAFTLAGRPFLHAAAWKRHIGLYPIPIGDDEFETAVASHRTTKDTLQLRHAEPMPVELLTTIIERAAARATPAGPD